MNQTKSLFEQYIETIPSEQMRVNARGMWKWVERYIPEPDDLLYFAPNELISMLNDRQPISPATVRGWIFILRSFFLGAKTLVNSRITQPLRSLIKMLITPPG